MKAMGYLLLISSTITAFCLALAVYVMTTGEVPFNVMPRLTMPAEVAATAPAAAGGTDYRLPETQAAALLAELQAQREKVAGEVASLADRQRAADELIRHAGHLQERMAEEQQRCQKLLDLIERTETANLKNVAKLIGEVESKAAAMMLGEMSVERAARVLYYMESRKASELLSTLLKQAPDKAKFAAEVTLHLQRVTDNDELREAVADRGTTDR